MAVNARGTGVARHAGRCLVENALRCPPVWRALRDIPALFFMGKTPRPPSRERSLFDSRRLGSHRPGSMEGPFTAGNSFRLAGPAPRGTGDGVARLGVQGVEPVLEGV